VSVGDDDSALDQLDALVEALGRMQVNESAIRGDEARAFIEDMKARVRAVAEAARAKRSEAERRKDSARAIDQLVDSIAKIENATGRAMAAARPQLKAAFRNVDLAGIANALRLLSAWLEDPTDDRRAAVEQLIANIRATTGGALTWEEARNEKQLEADIERDVRTSLDEIFRKKPPPKPI
jgi:hypothetical protein